MWLLKILVELLKAKKSGKLQERRKKSVKTSDCEIILVRYESFRTHFIYADAEPLMSPTLYAALTLTHVQAELTLVQAEVDLKFALSDKKSFSTPMNSNFSSVSASRFSDGIQCRGLI